MAKKLKLTNSFGKYILFSSLIIGASIIYYSFTIAKTTDKRTDKIEEILQSINLSPSPFLSPSPDTSIQKTLTTLNSNSETAKKVCLEN